MNNETTTVSCECGEATGECCQWSGPLAETVVIEWMPGWLRETHRAAGNAGAYPANGSLRLRVSPECAEMLRDSEDTAQPTET